MRNSKKAVNIRKMHSSAHAFKHKRLNWKWPPTTFPQFIVKCSLLPFQTLDLISLLVNHSWKFQWWSYPFGASYGISKAGKFQILGMSKSIYERLSNYQFGALKPPLILLKFNLYTRLLPVNCFSKQITLQAIQETLIMLKILKIAPKACRKCYYLGHPQSNFKVLYPLILHIWDTDDWKNNFFNMSINWTKISTRNFEVLADTKLMYLKYILNILLSQFLLLEQ